MKKNIIILIGIIVLIAVLYGGESLMNKKTNKEVVDINNINNSVMKSFSGEVIRNFEGDHMLQYSLNIPEMATTSIEMDGALIRVNNESGPVAQVYFSYEGGRGYSPLDYINNIVSPHVSVINPTGTSTIGNYDWQVAESEGSEWHIAKVMNGEWLVVVENKKSAHDVVEGMITSISAK